MITYKSICEKLGFDPLVDSLKYDLPGHEDDSMVNPFSVLSYDESLALYEYMYGVKL